MIPNPETTPSPEQDPIKLLEQALEKKRSALGEEKYNALVVKLERLKNIQEAINVEKKIIAEKEASLRQASVVRQSEATVPDATTEEPAQEKIEENKDSLSLEALQLKEELEKKLDTSARIEEMILEIENIRHNTSFSNLTELVTAFPETLSNDYARSIKKDGDVYTLSEKTERDLLAIHNIQMDMKETVNEFNKLEVTNLDQYEKLNRAFYALNLELENRSELTAFNRNLRQELAEENLTEERIKQIEAWSNDTESYIAAMIEEKKDNINTQDWWKDKQDWWNENHKKTSTAAQDFYNQGIKELEKKIRTKKAFRSNEKLINSVVNTDPRNIIEKLENKGLNDHPVFIEAVQSLIEDQINLWNENVTSLKNNDQEELLPRSYFHIFASRIGELEDKVDKNKLNTSLVSQIDALKKQVDEQIEKNKIRLKGEKLKGLEKIESEKPPFNPAPFTEQFNYYDYDTKQLVQDEDATEMKLAFDPVTNSVIPDITYLKNILKKRLIWQSLGDLFEMEQLYSPRLEDYDITPAVLRPDGSILKQGSVKVKQSIFERFAMAEIRNQFEQFNINYNTENDSAVDTGIESAAGTTLDENSVEGWEKKYVPFPDTRGFWWNKDTLDSQDETYSAYELFVDPKDPTKAKFRFVDGGNGKKTNPTIQNFDVNIASVANIVEFKEVPDARIVQKELGEAKLSPDGTKWEVTKKPDVAIVGPEGFDFNKKEA
jgi:hypothetical protein